MISEKQLMANRQNAQRSTGPRTASGKAVSSQNAIRHGLRADQAVIPGEDPAQFTQFRHMLLDDLAPEGALEVMLADRVVGGFWKLRRAACTETALIQTLHADDLSRRCSRPKSIQDDLERLRQAWQSAQFDGQNDYQIVRDAWEASPEAAMLREDRWPADPNYPTPDEVMKNFIADHTLKLRQQRKEAFLKNLEQQEADRQANPDVADALPPDPAVGRIMQRDMCGSQILARFQKYEGQIERSLYRALTELQKLQLLRLRQWVPAEPVPDLPSQVPEE